MSLVRLKTAAWFMETRARLAQRLTERGSRD